MMRWFRYTMMAALLGGLSGVAWGAPGSAGTDDALRLTLRDAPALAARTPVLALAQTTSPGATGTTAPTSETPPPPAAGTTAAEPTPPPPPPAKAGAETKPSRLRAGAWIAVASTVTLATAGAIFGLGAQSRSDEVTRRLSAVDPNTQQPPVFTPTLRDQLNQLQREGRIYNALAIAFLSTAGAAAITSGLLFWADHRAKKRDRQRQVLLVPTFGPRQAGISAAWRF